MSIAVERYLMEVGRRLPRGRRLRADVLDELRDGLLTALESQAGSPDAPDEHRRIVAVFGPPGELAAELGREVFQRLVRRSALVMLALLVGMALLWSLYAATIGVPTTMVPDDWTRAVFLGSTSVIKLAPVLSMIAALSLVIVTSIRVTSTWLVAARRVLAILMMTATAIFGLSMALIMATVTPEHRLETVALALPAAAALVLLIYNTMPAARRGYRTPEGFVV